MPPKPRKQHCTATTIHGKPCRNWAVHPDPHDPAATPPLCAIHAPHRPARTATPRCTARCQDGSPCPMWALPGSRPPRCYVHSPRRLPKTTDPRRCSGKKRDGTPCRGWAMRDTQGTDHPLCQYHAAGRHLPPGDSPARCTALTAAGHRCRNWAAGDTDPPQCAVHASRARNRRATPADRAAGRVCTAITIRGRPCNRWALAHTDPPLCWAHAYPDANPRIRHGFYRRTASLPPALAGLLSQYAATGQPLAAEIALLRLKIGALLAYLGRPDLSTARILAAYRLLQVALPLVARLLRTQQALTAGHQPPPPGTILSPSTGGWLTTPLTDLFSAEESKDPDNGR